MKLLKMTTCFMILSWVLLSAGTHAAEALELVIEESMKSSLAEEGISPAVADRISQQYMFMGAVMIRRTDFSSEGEEGGEDVPEAQAQRTGFALGRALASAYLVYGEDKLQETASVMMHAVRAGVAPEMAASAFTLLASNGYAFDAAVSVLHETSETMRSLRLADGGGAIWQKLREKVLSNASVGELKSEMRVLAGQELQRQKALLAKKEAARRARDSRGSDGYASDKSHGGGRGDASSAGRGGGEAGNDNTGNDNAGGANDNASGGNDASGGGNSNDDGSGGGNENDNSSAGSGENDDTVSE